MAPPVFINFISNIYIKCLNYIQVVSFNSWLMIFFFLFFFFFAYLPSPTLGLTRPGTYNPNARGSDACRGSHCLLTRTLDRYTRACLPECVVSTMSGPSPKTNTGRNTEKGHTPNPRTEIKIPDAAGNRTRAAGLEGRDSTDHATATDCLLLVCIF